MIRKKIFKRIFCEYSRLSFNTINAQIICKRHVYIKTDLDEKGSSEKVGSMFSTSSKGADATCLILMIAQTVRLNELCLDGYVRHLLENQNELSDGRTMQKYIP